MPKNRLQYSEMVREGKTKEKSKNLPQLWFVFLTEEKIVSARIKKICLLIIQISKDLIPNYLL